MLQTLLALAVAVFQLGNQPPAAPVITEPELDGQLVNPGDVHMESGAFADPDPSDTHRCSDWEIWRADLSERVWQIPCATGLQRYHTHLGDGLFENSHEQRSDLLAGASYVLQTRHSDDSGQTSTEWSPWSIRAFTTGAASDTFPLLLADVLDSPAPEWIDGSGEPIVLPAGPDEPFLRVESAARQLLLEYRGLDGVDNAVSNPAALAEHVAVRVHIGAGASGLEPPPSNLRVFDDDGAVHTILLPALALAPSEHAYFWVASNGASYMGEGASTVPDFSNLARGPELPWEVLVPGYEVEIFASGFRLPVNIAFVPEPGGEPGQPFFYVTELYGAIKVVTSDGVVSDYATGLLGYDPSGDFPGTGEQGVTGIVVDPATGDVFASMLYESALDPALHYPRVDRFTSTDGGMTAATRTTILDMDLELQGESHQISNLTFGPDGKLYVHMGDGFDATTAQDLDSYRGKILRINLDGSAPEDNPFYDPGDGIDARDHVYAYGVRNPFGGAWRELDGEHYQVENGPSVDRLSKIIPGQNYLWDGTNASMSNFALYNWVPATGPVNIAFIQNATFCGSGFPGDTFDRAYVTESGPTYQTGPQAKGKRITEFILDASGAVVSGPTPVVRYAGSGKATAVGLAAGPDGLYFSDLYKDLDYRSPIDPGANILRLRFMGGPAVDQRLAGDTVQWGAVPGALTYDVIRGDLGALRATGGDFSLADLVCLANDLPRPQVDDPQDPLAGQAFWYLVRDVHLAHVGCYESGGSGQRGTRDGEIAAAAAACP